MTKTYSSLDVTKLVLSIFIVILHVNPFGTQYSYIVYPTVRIAVPLFFMISAFLLFTRIDSATSLKQERKFLFAFIKRNLILYAVWFVILLPLTLIYRHYFEEGFFLGLWKMIVSFFFGSTFSASWFIVALVIGTIIIYFADKYINNTITLLISGFLYVLCCLVSNYGEMFESLTFYVSNVYPYEIFNSFPVALIWVFFGKLFAQKYKDRKPFSYKKIIYLVLSTALLFAEQMLITRFDCCRYNDCYFMLVLVCPIIFSLLLDWNLNLNCGKLLRVFSTVTYCLHASLRFVVKFAFEKCGYDIGVIPYSVYAFIIILSICAFASYLIYSLHKYRCLKWLRYLA
ncbi:MAG: acyltransferase family protein [Ruminococcus sp.]|nr:acyltransferase family protein [Ruminococcus sp.]